MGFFRFIRLSVGDERRANVDVSSCLRAVADALDAVSDAWRIVDRARRYGVTSVVVDRVERATRYLAHAVAMCGGEPKATPAVEELEMVAFRLSSSMLSPVEVHEKLDEVDDALRRALSTLKAILVTQAARMEMGE